MHPMTIRLVELSAESEYYDRVIAVTMTECQHGELIEAFKKSASYVKQAGLAHLSFFAVFEEGYNEDEGDRDQNESTDEKDDSEIEIEGVDNSILKTGPVSQTEALVGHVNCIPSLKIRRL